MDSLQLLYGEDLKILDNLIVKHPKLIDIKNTGYEKYASYVSAITMRPCDVADLLWFDMNIWYKDVTSWQLFVNMVYQDKSILKSLKFFTGLEFELFNIDGLFYLHNIEKDIYIDEGTFNVISDFIRDINFQNNKPDILKAGNKIAALTILQQQRKKRAKKSKIIVDLSSIISSLIWFTSLGNGIWDVPIYAVYEGYYRMNLRDKYDNTMLALYSGNIDTSKTTIDHDDLNWSKIIRI